MINIDVVNCGKPMSDLEELYYVFHTALHDCMALLEGTLFQGVSRQPSAETPTLVRTALGNECLRHSKV